MSARVLMIGLDAASLDFIGSSLPSLPNLRRAMEVGVRQRLRSTTSELLPPAVWPTMYAGTPPGVHGVYHHMQWDPSAMALRSVDGWLDCEPFWYELERRGLQVAALDVPLAFRSRLARGIEVTDWGTHDRLTGFHTSPAELRPDIVRRFGKHPMRYEFPVAKSPGLLRRMRDRMVEGARLKGELAAWLLGRRAWDFFIVVFSETHRAGHLFWPGETSGRSPAPPDAMLDVYRAVDGAIGRLLGDGTRRDGAVVIFAAHGMGPYTSQDHLTRKILDRANERFPGGGSGERGGHPVSRRFRPMRFLRERLPGRVQHAIGQATSQRLRDLVVNRALTGGYDWARTPAVALLGNAPGFIRFNLRGRERDGMLEPDGDRFARYVDWLREAFESVRALDTGERLVDAVHLTRDAFGGPRAGQLPDAVVSWTAALPASRVRSTKLGTITTPLPAGRMGHHRPDGFSITIDGDGGRGGTAPPGDILDLAPLTFRKLLEAGWPP